MSLIFDRTQEDVNFALQNKDKLLPNKGAYNYTDYNRVSKYANALANLLNENGYNNNINLKDNWTELQIIRKEDTDIYIEQLNKLFKTFYTFQTTPQMPQNIRELFTTNGFQKANNIEKIIYDISILLENMLSSLLYSDTFYSGEDFVVGGNAKPIIQEKIYSGEIYSGENDFN